MTLRETLERVRRMAVSGTMPDSEKESIYKVILPVLGSLGWETLGAEVMHEYAVGVAGRRSKSGGGGGKVDLALGPDPKRPVAMIEAKAPGQDLGQHVDQVLGYAFREGAPVCVLTNGVDWWLYLPREDGPFEDRRFAKLRIDEDPAERIADDLDAFLSRKALVEGSAEEQARRRLRARREAARVSEELPRVWSQMIGGLGDDPDRDLVELVSKRVYDRTGGLSPTHKQIAAVLRGSAVPPTAPPRWHPRKQAEDRSPRGGAASVQPGTGGGKGPGQRQRPSSGRPSGFELWEQLHPVRRYYDILVGVAQALHDRHPHDFQNIGERRGAKRLWASRRPGDLGSPKQVGTSGWYINTNMNGASTERRARQFLEHFGHSPDELRLLYSAEDTASPPAPNAAAASRRRRPELHGDDGRSGGETAKPTGLELWGRRYEVRSYNDIPVGVAQALHDRHSDDFHRIKELHGIKWPFASRRAGDLSVPKPVGTTGWYVDVNLSSPNTIKRAMRFLEHFGHSPDELRLLYSAEDAGATTRQPTSAEARSERATPRRGGETSARLGRTGATPASKPTGFELWGHHHPVHSFNDIPVGVAQAIYDQNPGDFHRIGELHGKKHAYASQNANDLHRAKQVGATGWHIDVKLSGTNAIKRARLFLKHFGHDPDALRLIYD